LRRQLARVLVVAGVTLGSLGVVQVAAHADPYTRIATGLTKAQCHNWGDNGERAHAWINYDCPLRNPNGYELWVQYR
jgi:hypothetical protein